jgi:hypothetical protein
MNRIDQSQGLKSARTDIRQTETRVGDILRTAALNIRMNSELLKFLFFNFYRFCEPYWL